MLRLRPDLVIYSASNEYRYTNVPFLLSKYREGLCEVFVVLAGQFIMLRLEAESQWADSEGRGIPRPTAISVAT